MRTAVLAIGLLFPSLCGAEHLFSAQQGGVIIDLYDDKCEIEGVTNLGYKAYWTQNQNKVEGCWGADQFGWIIFYWADKTVFTIPMQVFKKATRA